MNHANWHPTLYLFDTDIMKKTSKICFRTSDEIKDALIKSANAKQITLSALIENILELTVKKREEKGEERRTYPRKTEKIPIVIHGTSENNYYYHSGEIQDISLGGIRIRIPQNCKCRIRPEEKENLFEILFKVYNSDDPIIIKCASRRFEKKDEGMIIGATFQEAELYSYQRLQMHLITEDMSS